MNHVILWSLLSGLAALLSGCSQQAASGGGGRPPAQVIVAEAVRKPVTESLSLIGTLLANEMVEIKSEVAGTVEKIHFKEGEQVKAGAALITLDESKFAAAVAEAEATFELSKANYERSKQLFESRLVSQQESDQVAASYEAQKASLDLKRRQLKDARIHAPFEGVMGSRQISPGQVISANTTLTWLVDLDPVKVEINVPERFLDQLKVGQTIDVGVAAFPEQRFKGEVYFIGPFVDPATRTALLKAQTPNPDHILKPGMFANLELTLKVRDEAVVIPETALSQVLDDNRGMVFVVDDSMTAQLRQVRLGVRLAGEMEVLSGVQAGERVVVEGTQKIAPGAKVKLGAARSGEARSGSGQTTNKMESGPASR